MLDNHPKPRIFSESAANIEKIEADLKHRLAIVLESKTNSSVARDTGFHSETIRRYRSTGRMPASFLVALSQAYCINIDWLASGEGLPRTHSRKTNTVPNILRDIADEISNGHVSSAQPSTLTVLETPKHLSKVILSMNPEKQQ